MNHLKNKLNVNSNIFNMEITRFLFFWDVTLHHWVPDVLRQCSGLIFKGRNIQEEQISKRKVQFNIKPICYANDATVFQSTLHRVIRSAVWVAILHRCPATINPFPGKCTQYLHGFPHPPKNVWSIPLVHISY